MSDEPLDEKKRWYCRDCDFVHDKSTPATIHMANTDHRVDFVTPSILALLKSHDKK